MSNRSALVVGATGLVGKCCVRSLLGNTKYDKVTVLTRRPLSIKHQKLEEQIIDYERLSESSRLIKGDDLYCCLGTTMKKAGSKDAFYKIDFTYTYQIAEMAANNGVKQFMLVSSIGANKNSNNFYLKVKGEIEEAISKLPFKAVNIFRPSLLLGDRDEVRVGEKVGGALSRVFSFLFIGPIKKYGPIEAEVVANAMIKIAESGRTGIHIFESDVIQSQ